MAEHAYTDAEIDAAIAALTRPGRLRGAQELLAQAAPRLHRILDDSISEGGWFDQAHEQAIRQAAGGEDPDARAAAVRTLVADETRLGMFVGVAVGFELARELRYASSGEAGHGELPGQPPPPGENPPPPDTQEE